MKTTRVPKVMVVGVDVAEFGVVEEEAEAEAGAIKTRKGARRISMGQTTSSEAE